MMGRSSKLTPETQQKIITAISAGAYLETAAAHGSISETTFYRWLQEGEQSTSGAKREFWEAVKKAEADAELMRLARISKAGQEGSWQADAWYLERRYPNRWGKRVNEVSGPDGGPVQVIIKYADVDANGGAS